MLVAEQQRTGTPPGGPVRKPGGGGAPEAPPRTSLLLMGRAGTARAPETARPMTSHKSAGYMGGSSAGGTPTKRAGLGRTLSAASSEQCAELEDRVHALLEQSAGAAERGDAGGAVHAARDAARAEHRLCMLREQGGQADLISLPLKFAVGVQLASCYQAAGQLDEALRAYEDILRCQLFPQAGWLRLNMGNIHWQCQRYADAVRCYRMALDAVPPSHRRLRLDTMRNMSIALFGAGRHQEAVEVLQSIMQEGADHQTAFNLVVCCAAMQDAQLVREALGQLLAVPRYLGEPLGGRDGADSGDEGDTLQTHLQERQAEAERFVLTAARVVAPQLDGEGGWAKGFEWCLEQLAGAGYSDQVAELQLCKAVEQAWRGSSQEAVATLRKLQRSVLADDPLQLPTPASVAAEAMGYLDVQPGAGRAAAASFLPPLHQQNGAPGQAASAVNHGNQLLVGGQADAALAAYEGALEAAGPSVRLQLPFNAGLACRQVGQSQRALHLFRQVAQRAPAHVEALLQVADLCEEAGDDQGAVSSLTRLLAGVPHDSGVLSRLGTLQAKQGADVASFQCYLEAFRIDPTCLDTISWLGAREVRQQSYEGAILYFEAAARAQPKDSKWQLMVAGCLRRVGRVDAALELYRAIAAREPTNAEAQRYLAQLAGGGAA